LRHKEERLQAFEPLKPYVLQISRDIQLSTNPAVHDWLLLCYFATLKCVLTDRWDDCYAVIFDTYPDLGREVDQLLAVIEEIPFAAAITLLEREWQEDGKQPEFDIVALTFVRTGGMIGVFGGPRLYRRACEYLAYETQFLIAVLAAACFKVPALASRVNIGDWTDTQYSCMRVLDNFGHLGEATWG
jgi:hypothetical protein